MDQVYNSAVLMMSQYFPAIMYILALLIATIIVSARRHRPIRRHNINTFIAYIMLLAIGFSGIWGFVFHALLIKVNHFHYDLAVASLAFGITGIFAFQASHGYRVATTLMITIFLWAAAAQQLYTGIHKSNLLAVFMDVSYYYNIITPATLILLLNMHRQSKDNVFS